MISYSFAVAASLLLLFVCFFGLRRLTIDRSFIREAAFSRPISRRAHRNCYGGYPVHLTAAQRIRRIES